MLEIRNEKLPEWVASGLDVSSMRRVRERKIEKGEKKLNVRSLLSLHRTATAIPERDEGPREGMERKGREENKGRGSSNP